MRLIGLFLAALALTLAAGCAGGDDDGGDESATEETSVTTSATTGDVQPPGSTTASRLYKRAQLPRLALQPSDAPSGMRYARVESGLKSLSEIGFLVESQTAPLRKLGFRGVYDAIFDSTGSDVRLASRSWLFAKAAGARGWLDKTRGDSQAFALEPIAAPRLADESWAARGNLGVGDVISHAFRAGNVVVVVTFSAQSGTLSESAALAAAQRALARVDEV